MHAIIRRGGGLAEASVGKVDLGQITLGDEIIWEKANPYPPGVMILTIETMQENQVVNLGYNLGRWQGSTSADIKKIPHYGRVNWGDGSDEYTFNGKEGIEETEENGLVHTYIEAGEHRITIKGIVKWNKVNSNISSSNYPTGIHNVLKKIEIPENEISPIYFIDEHAFYYCKLLESIPSNLFENCSGVMSFYDCFSNCTSLQSLPNGLFDHCQQARNFRLCFSRTNITEIPQGLFKYCPLVTNFQACFLGSAITVIPKGLFDYCPLVTNFSACFSQTNITEIPQELFDKCTQVTDFSLCFSSSNITSIPDRLFDNCTQVTTFRNCFYAVKITKIPEELFKNNNKVTNFSYTFFGNSLVEGNLPELWDTHPVVLDHKWCFRRCKNASNYRIAEILGWA